VVLIEVDSSCCCLIAPLDVAPASPFIASKGRARVTFVVKGVKIGRMKEKNKKDGLGRGRPPPYMVGAAPL
jgi:hypothetical protein